VNSAVKAGREAEDGRINRSKSGNSLEIPPVSRERERERERGGGIQIFANHSAGRGQRAFGNPFSWDYRGTHVAFAR